MRIILILLSCFVGQQLATAQTAADRPTLLVFSGSDWCIPCIQLEKSILTDSIFLAYTAQHLAYIKADFPQRKQLDKVLQEQNEALAARYNPEGAFPKILLLRPDETIWTVLHWQDHDPESFTRQLDSYLSPH
jgi:thiamine biosynthesis lipoprotein